jgi:hypothetical protein
MARINGDDALNTLNGTAENDVIRGGSESDTLYGNDGNDILISGGGLTRLADIKTGLSGGMFTIGSQGWENNRTPRKLADVNGDGMADIVAFGAGGSSGNEVKVALAKGDGTFEAPKDALKAFTTLNGGWTNNDAYPRELADVNGDGRADIVGFSGTDVMVATAKEDGTFAAPRVGLSDNFTPEDGGWNSNDRNPRKLGDVNGDGLADIVGFSESAIHVSLGRGNGTFQKARVLSNQGFTPQSGGWTSNNAVPRELADVNGDGYADIIGFSSTDVKVALSNGDGTFKQAATALNNFSPAQGWSSSDRFPRKLADINGDGRADLVGFGKSSVFVALGQANGKFGPVEAKNYGFVQPSGFEDLDGFTKWLIDNKLASRTPGEWESQSRTPRELADINGDGIADIVGFGNDKVTVALMQEEGMFSERLYGGAGDDVLNGGSGNNILNGGTGSDRFVIIQPMWNDVAYQVIEDFEKGVDKLDFKGATKDLRFQRRGSDTVIKLNEAEIAIVKNAVIDSRDFVQTKAPALTPDQINDISALVEAWAQRYADSVNDIVGEVDLSNVKIIQGDIIYEQKPVISVGEPKTASITFRNSSTSSQSAQVTFGADTSWQTSGSNTTTWKVGGKLTAKAGWKTVVKASPNNTGTDSEVSKEVSVEISGEYGKTETRTEVTGGRSFDQTSFTTNTPANSVTTANITYNRQSFDSKFTIPVDITGTVKIDLQRGTTNDILDLPIGAILQYYNPSQFASVDPRNVTYSELPNGDYLAYTPTTRATVKGEAKGVVNVVGRQTVSTVIDHNLSNPASTPAAGYRGNQSNADRFWLSLGGLPAGRQPVKILDFATNEDRIGIVAPGVDRKADLTLSYDETANLGKIGVGSRTLAELPGVDPRSLAADSFLFSTTGSIFDNSLPLASSTLKALPV